MNTISSQSKTFKTSITKEEIAELPIEEFNGQIEVVQTIEEAKKALGILKEQKLLLRIKLQKKYMMKRNSSLLY